MLFKEKYHEDVKKNMWEIIGHKDYDKLMNIFEINDSNNIKSSILNAFRKGF